jgi:signal transduction histidine kinase
VWLLIIVALAAAILVEFAHAHRPLGVRVFNFSAMAGIAFAVVQLRRSGAEARMRRFADELEERVRERTHMLNESQRMARIGSFRWDARTHTNIWTDELFRIHEMEPAPLAPAQGYRDLIHPDDFEAVHASLARTYETLEPYDDYYRIVLPSGATRWIHAHGEPICDADGSFLGLQGTCQDVTESKEAELALSASEQAMRAAYEQEQRAADELRALDASKTTFLQAVSHELRTPLTTITGISSLLESGVLTPGDGHYDDMVARLVGNARRLASLLDDLLDLDRLSRGIIEARRRPTDVSALVEGSVEQIDLREHPITLEGQDVIGNVDSAQVERIVENLVANAVKHTRPETHIWVRTIQRDAGVELVVEDDGPGVLPAIKDSLFEPFVKDTRGFVPGTGIGLSLVARLAQVHGGKVWVEDREGGGASFHVWLPNGSESTKEPASADAA